MRHRRLKRAFDIILASTGIFVSLPVWVVSAVVIKLQDGGSVFFRQPRIGLHGKVFYAYKFRTMQNGNVTPFGRLLRATAMDELPQLWNIIRGDMSFVGPRALAEYEADFLDGKVVNIRNMPGFEKRCSVPPGLTGIAQVYAPKDAPLRHKIRYDLLYVKKGSFWLDLKLIVLSFLISFFGGWERKERLPRFMQWIYRAR